MFQKKLIIVGSSVGAILGCATLLRHYFVSLASFDEIVDLHDKVAIVTGANSGIGKEISRELSKYGAKVFMLCRDSQKCEDARREIVLQTGNKYVYCRNCDLASQESIRKFVNRFVSESKSLHILINNAGVMRYPVRELTKEGIEIHLGVNHMGHFLLTILLLDQLKNSTPSRIVNVTSECYKKGKINFEDFNSANYYDPSDAYNQSKLANILFTKELAKHLKGTGVTVCAVDPGFVATNIGRHLFLYKNVFTNNLIVPFFHLFAKNPNQGAQVVCHAALHSSVINDSGKYYKNFNEEDNLEETDDEQISQWLWKTSEKWTKLEKNEDANSKVDIVNLMLVSQSVIE